MLLPVPGIVSVVAAVLTFGLGHYTQAPPTLRETALASAGRPIRLPVIREIEPVTIAELAAKADLVLEGRLRPVRTYLSRDEQYIYTDYQVEATQIVLDREGVKARTPGPEQPAIVSLLGGELTIEGTSVTMVNYRFAAFKESARLLMFLRRTAAPGRRYELYRSAAGIFEIDEHGNMRALIRDYTNEEIRGQRVDDIVAKIKGFHGK